MSIPTESARFYSHVLPSPQEQTLFETHGAGQELGDDRRCGGVGGSADRRRIVLRDSLRRIAGTCAGGRMPGKISGVDTRVVFGGTGICVAHRAAVLSWIGAGNGGYHAHGAIDAAKPGVPATGGGSIQREPGLHEFEAAAVGASGDHGERVHFQRAESRESAGGAALRAGERGREAVLLKRMRRFVEAILSCRYSTATSPDITESACPDI